MTSNTSGTPSRRERLRAETVAEIKASARRQLLEHGPSGISLRAIAREVGMSPAALYRYFDSLDALLTELCCDFYGELIDATRAAMDVWPPEEHIQRIKAWIWTFRSWVVSHRREFELMLNVPDGQSSLAIDSEMVSMPLDDLHPAIQASMAHAQLCGYEFAAFYKDTGGKGFDFSVTEMPEFSEGLKRELLEQCCAAIIGAELPLNWVYAFTSGWVRVFGLVTMEAFGSLPVTENIDEFFKSQIHSMMRDFGIE